jgi:ABC-type uncharacterized transport system permease subunit
MPSLANISVTCFLASYLVAWVLELSRLFFRSRLRQVLMIGFATAGLVAHTIFLVERAVHGPQPPLSSSFDWCLLTAWVLLATYLYLSYCFPRSPLGMVVLPLVLLLVAAAVLWADRLPGGGQSALRAWGAIHGAFLLLGTVAVAIGFVAGIVYLLQAYRLKQKLPPAQWFRFPSLEWLERINHRTIFISTMMVGAGFVSGLILKMVRDRRVATLPWSDPIIWSSALMLSWLVAASIFSVVYRPARQGRKVAYLTVVSFLFLVFALAVLLVGNSEHGRGANAIAESPRGELSPAAPEAGP